jgi:hypothetical protein
MTATVDTIAPVDRRSLARLAGLAPEPSLASMIAELTVDDGQRSPDDGRDDAVRHASSPALPAGVDPRPRSLALSAWDEYRAWQMAVGEGWQDDLLYRLWG